MCFVNVVWAVAFVHVETAISIVNSSTFEDYCHVWCAMARLVQIYRYVWGKSVNFHCQLSQDWTLCIHCLHCNKCLFICIFLQRILLKLLVFVMCFGSVLFYICQLVLTCILFCIINIIACYIYVNLLCLHTTMGSVLSHWTCCTNWCYTVLLCFIYHIFVYMICSIWTQTPAVFNLFCCLYACLEFIYCTTAATVQINVSFKSYFCVVVTLIIIKFAAKFVTMIFVSYLSC